MCLWTVYLSNGRYWQYRTRLSHRDDALESGFDVFRADFRIEFIERTFIGANVHESQQQSHWSRRRYRHGRSWPRVHRFHFTTEKFRQTICKSIVFGPAKSEISVMKIIQFAYVDDFQKLLILNNELAKFVFGYWWSLAATEFT